VPFFISVKAGRSLRTPTGPGHDEFQYGPCAGIAQAGLASLEHPRVAAIAIGKSAARYLEENLYGLCRQQLHGAAASCDDGLALAPTSANRLALAPVFFPFVPSRV